MTAEERSAFIAELASALKNRAVLSDDEKLWVRMAIEREAQSSALRRAIIEKTLTALLWGGFLGAWYVVADFFKNHGFK